MCFLCKCLKKRSRGNDCYANFSAPRCNRTTPRMNHYLANDLSVYENRNSCCEPKCCCEPTCCCVPCDPCMHPRQTFSPESYFGNTSTGFDFDSFPYGACCDLPKKGC